VGLEDAAQHRTQRAGVGGENDADTAAADAADRMPEVPPDPENEKRVSACAPMQGRTTRAVAAGKRGAAEDLTPPAT
jgi:hypothetical protein